MSEEKKNEILSQGKELDEAELEAVSGAIQCACPVAGTGNSRQRAKPCACFAGGYGKDDKNECVCVAVGAGVE